MDAADAFWTDGHREHREAFTHSLPDAGDDLGAVVRAQVFVEYYLQAAIEAALKDPRGLGKRAWSDYLGFDARLRLFKALGGELTDALWNRVRLLSQIRNGLAHNIGASVAERDARSFISLLNEGQRFVVSSLAAKNDWRRGFRVSLWIHVLDVRLAATVLKKRYDRLRPLIEEQFRTFQVILHADDLEVGMPFGLLASDTDGDDL